MPTDLPAPKPPEPADSARESSPWRGVQGVILMISLLALVVLFLLPLFSDQPGRGRPWRVAILEPQIKQAGELGEGRQALVREAIADCAERIVGARRGLIGERLALDDPSTSPAMDDRAVAGLAHGAGFDEILLIQLDCPKQSCRTVLRRLRSVDGSMEWRRSFSLEPADLLALEGELAGELHVAYLKFTRRQDGARLLADASTYQAYLQTTVDHRRGLISTGKATSILADLRPKAPRFQGLHLREAELRIEDGEKQRAADLLVESHRIAPGDVRPLLRLMPLLLELRRQDEALETLARLDELIPGEPRLLTWREYVAE